MISALIEPIKETFVSDWNNISVRPFVVGRGLIDASRSETALCGDGGLIVSCVQQLFDGHICIALTLANSHTPLG